MASARISIAILVGAVWLVSGGVSADPPAAAPQLPSPLDHADGFWMRNARHCPFVTSLTFSPDDCLVASGAMDGYLRMWDVETQEQLWAVEAHRKKLGPEDRVPEDEAEKGVYGIAFAPDGKSVATAGADAAIRIWRVVDGKLLQTLEGHERLSICVAYAPDGKTLAAGDVKGTIRIWDLGEGKCTHKIAAHPDGVTSLVFWKNGEVLISGGFVSIAIHNSGLDCVSDHITLWDVKTGKSLAQIPTRASHLALTRDETILACGGIDYFVDPTGKRNGAYSIDGVIIGFFNRVDLIELPSAKTVLSWEDRGNQLLLAARSRHVIFGSRSCLHQQSNSGANVCKPYHERAPLALRRIEEDREHTIKGIPMPTVHRHDRNLKGILVPTAMAVNSRAETLTWSAYTGDVWIQPLLLPKAEK